RLIDQVMTKHRSGLHVLARPTEPEQAEVLTGEHVRHVLTSLAQMYQHVVIDGVLSYDERMLATLDLADQYVITLTPHLGTLRSARHFLHVARTLGFPDDRMCFVLNRASNLAGLSVDDIATALDSRAIHQMPAGGPASAEIARGSGAPGPLRPGAGAGRRSGGASLTPAEPSRGRWNQQQH